MAFIACSKIFCRNSYGLLRENTYIHTHIHAHRHIFGAYLAFIGNFFSPEVVEVFFPTGVSLYEVLSVSAF